MLDKLDKPKAQKILDGLRDSDKGFTVEETRKIEGKMFESLLRKVREIKRRPPLPRGPKLVQRV